uniref:Centromere protein N n=1 Tax=Arion vulgaris TaxID=1028688 RepID=A0A0B6ZYE3_9EUPU
MNLHYEIILSVLSRCKVSSIRETLRQWGRLSSAHLNDDELFRGTKRQIADNIIQLLKENALTNDIVGDLELVYMQLHSRLKTWVVYKLKGSDACLNLDPRMMRSKVLHSLQLKWSNGQVLGNIRLFAGAVWLRINLGQSLIRGQSKKLYNHSNSVFVITFHESPYIIMNKMNVRLLKVVKEAIIDALNAESLKDIQLSGHHVSSLADIVLNKDNKILISKYRDKEEMENPLIVRQDRKRKILDDSFLDTETMVDENREEKRTRKAIIEKNFGTESQHVLEKLEYKFSVKFYGKPASDVMCKSSVEIKGKSVLDGLCELAAKGLVKIPLPKHLSNVTSSARSSFTIESSNRQ